MTIALPTDVRALVSLSAALGGGEAPRIRKALERAANVWMVVEGYGKVLARDGLAVETRELCIVALLAPTRHEPQLHSHLRGALNAGLPRAQVEATLRVAYEGMDDPAIRRAKRVWDRVRDRHELA